LLRRRSWPSNWPGRRFSHANNVPRRWVAPRPTRVPVVLKLTTWEMPGARTSLSGPVNVPRKGTAWPTMGAAARRGATCCMAEPAESRVFPSKDSSCGDMGRRHLACVRIGLPSFHLRGIAERRVREFGGRRVSLVMQPLRAHHLAFEEEYRATN